MCRILTHTSQSLLNQGNIQIVLIREDIFTIRKRVSIPFKSGKYSNMDTISIPIHVHDVSIPFKSGKYSNMIDEFQELLNQFRSQSLLNQGNIQIKARE